MADPDARLDPRAAARAAVLRAACSLPIARIHGSLVGRPAGVVWTVAIEPGGRHAAVLVIGAVERWDLDALECVGSWPLPRDLYPGGVVCVGETPAGLRFIADRERWSELAPAEQLPVRTVRDSWIIGFTDPPTPSVIEMVDGEQPVLVRIADGLPFCDVPAGRRRWCDPDGRYVVVERSRTAFDVLAVVEGSRTPRFVATLAVDEALAGEACVAVDARGRRVALVFESTAVIGAWDRWPAARTFPVPALAWTDFEFCADGRTLVLCAPGCVARIDTKTGRTSETRFAAAGREHFAVDTATGRVLHADGAGLRVIDGTTVRTRVTDHGPPATALAATSDILVTSADDGSLRVRDRATGRLLVQMQCPTREPHSVAVTSDDVIAVGVADGLLRWSLKTGHPRPRIALGRTSEYAPPRLVLAPDGRHLALTRCDARRDATVAFVVDLATGRAHRAERIELNHGRCGLLCLGFAADRLRGATVTDYSRRLEFWSRPLAGGRREPAGESSGVGGDPLAVSTDGRLLWWERVDDGEVWLTAAAVDVAATPLARWEVDGKVVAACAGRSLLAIAAGGELTLLDADGRELATDLPEGCRPLAFAPDDRALWVYDEAGLLLELSIAR